MLLLFHLGVEMYVRHRAQTLQLHLHPVSGKKERERKRKEECFNETRAIVTVEERREEKKEGG